MKRTQGVCNVALILSATFLMLPIVLFPQSVFTRTIYPSYNLVLSENEKLSVLSGLIGPDSAFTYSLDFDLLTLQPIDSTLWLVTGSQRERFNRALLINGDPNFGQLLISTFKDGNDYRFRVQKRQNGQIQTILNRIENAIVSAATIANGELIVRLEQELKTAATFEIIGDSVVFYAIDANGGIRLRRSHPYYVNDTIPFSNPAENFLVPHPLNNEILVNIRERGFNPPLKFWNSLTFDLDSSRERHNLLMHFPISQGYWDYWRTGFEVTPNGIYEGGVVRYNIAPLGDPNFNVLYRGFAADRKLNGDSLGHYRYGYGSEHMQMYDYDYLPESGYHFLIGCYPSPSSIGSPWYESDTTFREIVIFRGIGSNYDSLFLDLGGNHVGSEVVASSDGSVYFLGAYTFDDVTPRVPGVLYGLVGKITNYAFDLVEEIPRSHRKLRVFPNPTSDVLQVDAMAANQPYALIDGNGKQVDTGSVTEEGIIRLPLLSEGVYYIRFQGDVLLAPVAFIYQ